MAASRKYRNGNGGEGGEAAKARRGSSENVCGDAHEKRSAARRLKRNWRQSKAAARQAKNVKTSEKPWLSRHIGDENRRRLSHRRKLTGIENTVAKNATK